MNSSKLKWYFNRLRSMDVAEILHRIREKRNKQTARGKLEGWAPYADFGNDMPKIPGLAEAFKNATPAQKKAIARDAAFLLAGNFVALGQAWPKRESTQLFQMQLWSLDPVSGLQWPGSEAFSFDIPYRHEQKKGDVKYVWEINRLQFLHVLAAQVFFTGDKTAEQAIVDAIESWFDANPPYRGINWNSGIEVALRSVSLLVVTSLCGDTLPVSIVKNIRIMLAAHVAWLQRFPSAYSSANNHLIAECAGEILIGLACPALVSQQRLHERCAKLESEIGKQIYADGTPAEQSPTYGAFTAEWAMLCAYAGANSGLHFGEGLQTRLSVFSQFIATVCDQSGNLPHLGDNDEGRVLNFTLGEVNYAQSIARQATDKEDLRALLFAAPTKQPKLKDGLTVFPDGGISVARGPNYHLTLDHGPLGYLTIAAHGHADALSIMLSINGTPILVDPGTYLYHSGGAWRDWFRGTRAHNTLSIDNENQSKISGAFNWSHKARAKLVSHINGPMWSLVAQHNGYVSAFRATHQRSVAKAENGITIHDQLLGKSSAACEIVFQFAHNVDLVQNVDRTEIQILSNKIKMAILHLPKSGHVTLSKGGAEFDGGWVSTRFSEKLPAWRLSWRGAVDAVGVKSFIEFC
jgi:Heparinase II/III-like protein/Heparinase II/III N-terminus